MGITLQSQRASEDAARYKTEKIISSELQKAACKPELFGRVNAISSISGLPAADKVLIKCHCFVRQTILEAPL